jgi:hypothetical protein
VYHELPKFLSKKDLWITVTQEPVLKRAVHSASIPMNLTLTLFNTRKQSPLT